MSSTPPPGQSPGGWGEPTSGGLPGEGAGSSSGGWGQQSPPQQGGGWNQPAGQQPGGGWNQPTGQPPGWNPQGGVAPGRAPGGGALASWGSRVLAQIVDGVVLSIVGGLLIGVGVAVLFATSSTTIDQFSGTTTMEPSGVGILALLLGILLYVVFAIIYLPYFMSKWNGQTPGKRVANCRVVRDDGQPVTFGFGFVREILVKNLLFGTVLGVFCGIPTVLNLLWPLWDDHNEALHDKLIKTHVLQA